MTSYAEVNDVMNMLYGTSPIETVTTCARPVIIKLYHHIAVYTYRNYEIILRITETETTMWLQ